MSYAIIKTGGKQYKVKAGEILKIEKLPDSKPESKIEFNEILAYGDDKSIEIGTPHVEGAKVEADLIKNGKDRTILIFKKRRRHNSRRKNGHRQEHTMIRINKIFSKDGKVLSEAEKMVKPTKKIEWSLPIPTFSPGKIFVPLCLTIIFPGITVSPPYFLTPSLRPALSRPFLDDPPAFFVAITYLIYLLATSVFTLTSVSTFLVGLAIFSASAKTLPSLEKILLILIIVCSCL